MRAEMITMPIESCILFDMFSVLIQVDFNVKSIKQFLHEKIGESKLSLIDRAGFVSFL